MSQVDNVNSTDTIDIKHDVQQIIDIIEKRELSSVQIMKQYHISSYRFYKILHEYNLVTKKLQTGTKKGASGKTGPKNTKFKQLLYGTAEQQKEAKLLPESFVMEDFISDSKNGLKIKDLMPKYNLTLYQIRELRKQFDLKTK
jgi:hypothetical protein